MGTENLAMTNQGGNSRPSVLIVGLGSVGYRHLSNLISLGCRNIGAVRTRNRTIPPAEIHQNVKLYANLGDALNEGYDAVIISNPTAFHMDTALKAARSGCHLYIEKPISHNTDNADELFGLIKQQGLTAVVGCQFRFHPHLIAIRSWMKNKKIGNVIHIHVDTGEYLPLWHPWEDYRDSYASRKELGGGVILTLIHELDYLHWIFGPLKSVAAIGGKSGRLDVDVEDHVTSLFETDNQIPITMHLDFIQQPACRKMKIIGNDGIIEWDSNRHTTILSVDGRVEENLCLPEDWDRNNLFVSAMDSFLQAIKGEIPPKTTIEDGLEVLEAALKIKSILVPNHKHSAV